jgi:AraC family transcriptional regulator
MKWIDRLTDCVDYIEENHNGEIDMDVLCDKACLSRLYFPRLFEAVTGVGLSAWISFLHP